MWSSWVNNKQGQARRVIFTQLLHPAAMSCRVRAERKSGVPAAAVSLPDLWLDDKLAEHRRNKAAERWRRALRERWAKHVTHHASPYLSLSLQWSYVNRLPSHALLKCAHTTVISLQRLVFVFLFVFSPPPFPIRIPWRDVSASDAGLSNALYKQLGGIEKGGCSKENKEKKIACASSCPLM